MSSPPAHLHLRAAAIRLVAFDVDGTLTDGAICIGPDGELMKQFSVRDGFGIALLREAGLRLAIVTGRSSAIVARRAAELRFDDVLQGVRDKGSALLELARRHQLQVAEIAFMGDDWPDLPAMALAGLAAAPVDADPEVIAAAHWVSTAAAGHGAVREFATWLLAQQGRLGPLLEGVRRPGGLAPEPPGATDTPARGPEGVA